MRHWRPKRFTREMAVRIIADVFIVNAALLIALISRYLWLVGIQGSVASTRDTFHSFVRAYLSTSWLLTLTSILVFYSSGFYTRGRFYRGRYKALVIAQAVTSSHLVFAFLILILRDLISFPRSALVLAWVLTLVFVSGARLWPVFWRVFAQASRRLLPPASTEGRIRNVLVIGGAGYIGSVLVQRLLELGYRVRVLDLLLYGDASISGFTERADFELIQGDFRNIHAVVGAARGMDAIVHLGAIVGDSACCIDQDLTIEINLRATRTIAEVGKGFGVQRFVFASTCSVYGASDEILDERSALCPISLYARTKMESEEVLLGLGDDAFSPTILRFGTVYGLSRRPRFDLVVNLLAARAIQDGEVSVFGGQQWRPLVHVRDVAEAIVLTLQAPLAAVQGQVFNVGCNEQNYQIVDLGEIIKEMVPAARVITQPTEDHRNYRVQFDKLCNLLNFQPRYTVRDGIREITDAFAARQISDYRDPRYSNSTFLSQEGELGRIFVDEEVGADWVRLSPDEASMLADVVMAVTKSRSRELMARLHQGLMQVSLGDVDGLRNMLVNMEVALSVQSEADPALDRPSALAQP